MECRYSRVFGTALFVCLALPRESRAPRKLSQHAQTTAANASVNASLGELQSQVQELKQMVLQLQQETSASRAEISKLRQELQAQRAESYPLQRLLTMSNCGELASSAAPAGTAGAASRRR